MDVGRTICLYGDSGSGKTTQIGEVAKRRFKQDGKRTVYVGADMGGYDSILPLVKLDVIRPIELTPTDDPWIWINDACEGKSLTDDIGVVAFDSGTSMSEALLTAIVKSDFKIGTQNTQRFTVTRGEQTLTVGANNEAHYGIVQSFMLDNIWRSTWLSRKGIDVLWTFSVHRGEKADDTPILGPKLAGKALTAAIPKWFKYTFRIVSLPQPDAPARHLLYVQEQQELAGMGMSFGNARFPLDAGIDFPAVIEPASITTALDLIDQAQEQAESNLRNELGL